LGSVCEQSEVHNQRISSSTNEFYFVAQLFEIFSDFVSVFALNFNFSLFKRSPAPQRFSGLWTIPMSLSLRETRLEQSALSLEYSSRRSERGCHQISKLFQFDDNYLIGKTVNIALLSNKESGVN
jgi:hypothetical protein